MDFSSKKWPQADLITKNWRFLFVKSSGHFFVWKTCFANRGFFGLQTKDYVFLLEPQYIFLEYSDIFFEYSNMFLECSNRWGVHFHIFPIFAYIASRGLRTHSMRRGAACYIGSLRFGTQIHAWEEKNLTLCFQTQPNSQIPDLENALRTHICRPFFRQTFFAKGDLI